MEPIFHIADEADWYAAAAAGAYTRSTRGKSLEEVGFIHCSFAHQVAGVAKFSYADASEPLVLLRIDPQRVTAPIQIDDGFPHIYGPLHTDAVTEVQPFHVP
jgi:uncharacterized protein (DUF952 family)